jgi:hypothetical protein
MIKWSLTETARDEWWAVDMSTGVAYAVPPHTGETLWRAANVELPLAIALEDPSTTADDHSQPMIDLEFAGVTARYLVEDEQTLTLLETQFASAVPPLRSLPDLVVKISPDADLDRLHRAVSDPRSGVWTRKPGEPQWIPAAHDLPVIPPIQGTSLAAEVVAVHAALVLNENTAMLLAGRQRSGKTTAAIVSQEAGLGKAATDELVLLGHKAIVYGVPLPWRIRSDDGRRTEPMPLDPVLARQPCRATHLLLLDDVSDAPRLSAVVTRKEALAELSQHIRPLDLSLGRTAQLALELLAEVSVWRLACRKWPHLRRDLEAGLKEFAAVTTTC